MQSDLQKNIDAALGGNSGHKIEFIAVDKNYPNEIIEDGIHFFGDDVEVRKFKLGKKNVIYLNEVPDSNCKKCYGTGKLGTLTKQVKVSQSDIACRINTYIVKEPEKVPMEIIKLLNLHPDREETLKILTRIISKEIGDDIFENFKVCEKYAKMIKKDFPVQEVMFCKCFQKNLMKEIELTRRNLKFSIN